MNLRHNTHKHRADLNSIAQCEFQFEFMSINERLQNFKDHIKIFKHKKPSCSNRQFEHCTMLHFALDSKDVTEARHLVISLCKDKLIFMRIKTGANSSVMQVELFLKASIGHAVKELMKSRFNC